MPTSNPKHYAVIGAGVAGITCARNLVQAGHRVTVFEQSASAGGRMSSHDTPFGSFDPGAQYFTVRSEPLVQALENAPGICKPWSANAVRVLDDHGQVVAPALPSREPHWVASPGMSALPQHWIAPLEVAGQVRYSTTITRVEPDALDASRWQLRTSSPAGELHVYGGLDGVLLAVPAPQAVQLLQDSGVGLREARLLSAVQIAPCWTLMLAFPNASQPDMVTLGPQWNAARSTHHRVAWLARESSKPGRKLLERWTVQASAAWSQEHRHDDPARIVAKLSKAFTEITGIHAAPTHAEVLCWPYAQTTQPLGSSHLWDAKDGLGACGDWCIGHRVEDAYLSGLALAQAVAASVTESVAEAA